MEMSNLKNRNRMSANKEDSDQTDQTAEPKTASVVSQRMTIAGGLLDISLFVANVEHLKFIFDTGKEDIEYYDLLLSLLFTSLTLQIIVGILLFIVGFGKNMQTLEEQKWTKILNHIIIGLVSMIAITDIFITTFGDRGETIVRYRNRHSCQLKANIANNVKSINSTLFSFN